MNTAFPFLKTLSFIVNYLSITLVKKTMNIKQIKEEIGNKTNCLADASLINSRCKMVCSYLKKELEKDSNLEFTKQFENVIEELEKIPILFQSYSKTVSYNDGLLIGDGLCFTMLANTAYNVLEGIKL